MIFLRIELVESFHAIQTGELIQGSIGQVFDCCAQPLDAFDCIKNISGVCRKTDYPKPLGKCELNTCKPFATVSSYFHEKSYKYLQVLV